MTKKQELARLIEQEKILYLEVEQLRFSLYLHDESLLFQFLSAFYFAFQDIRSLFIPRKSFPLAQRADKRLSVQRLQDKRARLAFLKRTPYAWGITLLRTIWRYTISLPYRLKKPRQVREKVSKKSLKPYLIFGSTHAADLQDRSVQLARLVSKKQRVIYVEGVFDEVHKPGFRITGESPHFTAIRLGARKQLHLVYQKPSHAECAFLKKSLQSYPTALRDSIPYIHHPFWNAILQLKSKSFFFDHQVGFKLQSVPVRHLIDEEKRLMQNASLITAPNPSLLGNKKGTIIKNGVDWDMFKDTSQMIQTCDVGLCWIKKPVIGYIGTLDERIDEALIASIATAFPNASLVLVGNTDYRPIIEVAEKFPNIFPVGKQPYKKLPLFLQSFDILITPFKRDKKAPMEHPEFPLYLASGKPALHTSGVCKGQQRKYGKFVYYPTTHADWMHMIHEALSEKPRNRKKSLRIAEAKKLGWKVNLK